MPVSRSNFNSITSFSLPLECCNLHIIWSLNNHHYNRCYVNYCTVKSKLIIWIKVYLLTPHKPNTFFKSKLPDESMHIYDICGICMYLYISRSLWRVLKIGFFQLYLEMKTIWIWAEVVGIWINNRCLCITTYTRYR